MVRLLEVAVLAISSLALFTSALRTPKPESPRRRQIQPALSISNPPCPLPVWIAHDLSWKNASNHLDCDPRNLRASGNGPASSNSLCYTGMPKQPPGYGPPEVFRVDIEGIGPCRQSNPGSVPTRQIGSGYIRCGSSAPTLFFSGSSNEANSTATFRVSQQFPCLHGVDEDGDDKIKMYTATGEVNFNLVCEHDEDFNATCRAVPPRFKIPVTSIRRGYSRIVWDDV